MPGGAPSGAIKVSVIVPAFNTRGVIGKGLDALRHQTMAREDFEVIYVDDGSTDGTDELLAEETAGEVNFQLIRNPPSGWPGKPRNTGLAVARGEYVFFADDDDWLEPDALRALYLRARRDQADIVIGRIAAHGRNAPLEIFRKSRTGADIRTDAVLMTTMTVHKLFRRDFLAAHDITFPEGKIRLEDNLFTLKALLSTDRVSVLHDQTVYHLVRDRNVGNNSFQRPDPHGYAASVALIIALITEMVDEGPVRDRLIANWYKRKMLDRFRTRWYVDGDNDYVEALCEANRAVAEASVPSGIDQRLPAFHRMRAVLLRAGEAEALRWLCAYERTVEHVATLRQCRWVDSRLVVMVTAGYDQAPRLALRRDGGRIRIDVPADITASLPATVKEALLLAADVTDEVRNSRIRGYLSNVRPTGDVFCPTTFTIEEAPLGGDRFTLRYSAEIVIDPTAADRGSSLSGTWSAHTMVDLCGHRTTSAIGAERRMLPAAAFVGIAGQLTRPYAAGPRSHLRLASSTSDMGPLRDLAATRRGNAQEFGGTLRLDIPLLLGAAPPLSLPTTVVLRSADTGQDIRFQGRILPPAGSDGGGAVLVADVAARRLAYGAGTGRWTIGVATTDNATDLGAHLIYRGGGEHHQWSITPSWRSSFGQFTAGLRRTSRSLRSRLLART